MLPAIKSFSVFIRIRNFAIQKKPRRQRGLDFYHWYRQGGGPLLKT